VSILNDAVDVLRGSTLDSPTFADTNVDNESALMLLLEEISEVGFHGMLRVGIRNRCNPDGLICSFFCEKIDALKVINIDLSS